MTTIAHPGRPVIAFDVLGTLVDQAGSMRRQVSAATGADAATARRIVTAWLAHVARREREIIAGDSAFVPSHELDVEALNHIAAAGQLPTETISRLASVSQHLEPWPDTVEAVAHLAADVTVVGLSNASHRVLTGLSGNTGMRWHHVFSAEDARTYKPDPAIYQLPLNSTSGSGHPPYLVAAHAWDLRAAARAGLRTAYVPRPGGDPPGKHDTFDLYADNLAHLHEMLRT